jgi:hypothetical protein
MWLRGAAFVVWLAVASWPWETVQSTFAERFCQLMAPMLETTTFHGKASVVMEPLVLPSRGASGSRETPSRVTPPENIVADTALVLRLTKYAGQMQVHVSLRRDVYLPLVIFSALVVVAPLPWKRRWWTLGLGSLFILLVGVGSVYVLLANVFSGRVMLAPQLAEVYPVSGLWGDVLQFLYDRWLTPPSSRVVGPLLLALGVLALQVEHLRLPRSSRVRAVLEAGHSAPHRAS